MRRFSFLIALVATLALLRSSTGVAATTARTRLAPPLPPRIGQPAPDFALVDQNGKTVTLSAARGEKVVLVFYRGYW